MRTAPSDAVSDPTSNARRVYAPIALAVVGGLAALLLLNPEPGLGLLSQAHAQPPVPQPAADGEETSGRISAAEQRKEIIAQLRSLNARMEHVESMLTRGLNVKVTEMPALRIPKDDQ